MNRYPVISLSLKFAKQPTWDLAFLMLKRNIAYKFKRHSGIIKQLKEYDKKRYQVILKEKGDFSDYLDSIAFLSMCLQQYFEKKSNYFD